MTDRSRIGKNNRLRGASYERDIARRLGCTRWPANSGGPADLRDHPTLEVQVRSGGRVVTEIQRDGMAQALAAAVASGKLPALVTVDRRGTRLARWITFRLEDFCALQGYDGEEEP